MAYTQLDHNYSLFIENYRITIFNEKSDPVIEGYTYELIKLIKEICDFKGLSKQATLKAVGLLCRLKETGQI